MATFIRRIQTILLPILGAGAVGVCPLCWAGSASLLTYAGLGALIPVWRKIALGLILVSGIGFILDFRSHKNSVPLVLLTIGGVLLFLGRYTFVVQPSIHIFKGIEGFAGWPIWGLGGLLVLMAVIFNKQLFRKKKDHG